MEDKISKMLVLVLVPTFLAIGMTGNILIILVIRRGVFSSVATSLSFGYLAIVDMIVLAFGLVGLVKFDARFMTDMDDTYCKLHSWILYSSVSFSSWALVFITSQRIISIYFPLQTRLIVTKSKTLIGLITMTIVIAGLNSCQLFFSGLTSGYNGGNDPIGTRETLFNTTTMHTVTNISVTANQVPTNISQVMQTAKLSCSALPQYAMIDQDIWPWVDLFVTSVIPAFFLIIGNVLISYRLLLFRRERKIIAKDRTERKTNTVSILLVATTSLFLVCTLPIVLFLAGLGDMIDTSDYHGIAIYDLISTAFNLLQYLNSTSNFALYCLTSKVFRTKLLDLLCSCRKRQRKTHETASTIFSLTTSNIH